ncbi:MAG: ATP phosphoribosyltransferase [Oscillospiraceae bacterium]|nr:ATP phosphoribosyltransferase [Oscillospiraceae bacterium]
MESYDDVLKYDEQIIYKLRSLFKQYGYSQYRMSRFEEYELYAENKAFLATGDIITFSGSGGKLLALRPDVTLSIVKYAKDDGKLKKLFYNENIYRSDGHELKEQMQVGLECIGDITLDLMGEVLMLAAKSLETPGRRASLEISHMGFISGLLKDAGQQGAGQLDAMMHDAGQHDAGLQPAHKADLLRCLSDKNVPELQRLCGEFGIEASVRDRLVRLISLYGTFDETFDELKRISVNDDTEAALGELAAVHDALRVLGAENCFNFDFSIVNDLSYYNGIIFQGFIEGIPKKVLSGGRYDELLRKFGKNAGAIGFAVNIDLLEPPGSPQQPQQSQQPQPTRLPEQIGVHGAPGSPQQPLPGMPQQSQPPSEAMDGGQHIAAGTMINVALPKGRLGESVYEIFEAAGYGCPSIRDESRRLVFEDADKGIRYFWVKPSDVTIYVERGVADIGVVGKDILLEYSPDLYELMDLGVGRCRMCVAAMRGFDSSVVEERTLRVATTFTNIARNHYAKMGRDIDIIKLNGSIELAPLLGLSDVIVDLVESGKTLEENDLVPIDTIVDISARLVANKAGYKFKHDAINILCGSIRSVI